MRSKQNLQGLLTICRKAGKLAMGLEPAKSAIEGGRASGLIVCTDASPRSKKEAAYFAAHAGIGCTEVPFTKLEMGQYIGRAAGVLAVCDDGFFRRIETLVKTSEETAHKLISDQR